MYGKILVVDDEQPIADILKFNLEKKRAMRSFALMTAEPRSSWHSRRIRI